MQHTCMQNANNNFKNISVHVKEPDENMTKHVLSAMPHHSICDMHVVLSATAVDETSLDSLRRCSRRPSNINKSEINF